MTDERMDKILETEDELIPSSGFISAVMDRVREEAAAPPPIPFPWKRAVPGLVVAAGVFGWTAVEFGRMIAPAISTLRLPLMPVSLTNIRPLEQAGWVMAALAVSVASWMLSRRICR